MVPYVSPTPLLSWESTLINESVRYILICIAFEQGGYESGVSRFSAGLRRKTNGAGGIID